MLRNTLTTIALFTTIVCSAAERPVAVERDFGTLYGTLRIPDAGSDVAALIIAGSGPTDRDGNSGLGLTTNCYLQLAEELEAQGIASLRYDKRAIAASVMQDLTKIEELTLDDYVGDAVVLADWLRDEGFSKVILVGHSEGALIAMLAANLTPSATAVVSLAGAAYPLDEIMRLQLARQLMQHDMLLQIEAEGILASLRRGEEVDMSRHSVALRGLFGEHVQKFLISQIRHKPQEVLRRVAQPVLVIGGEYDIQVTPDNAEALARARQDVRKVIIPKMSHVLKPAESADATLQIQTVYRDAVSPLAEGLTEAIAEFAGTL